MIGNPDSKISFDSERASVDSRFNRCTVLILLNAEVFERRRNEKFNKLKTLVKGILRSHLVLFSWKALVPLCENEEVKRTSREENRRREI